MWFSSSVISPLCSSLSLLSLCLPLYLSLSISILSLRSPSLFIVPVSLPLFRSLSMPPFCKRSPVPREALSGLHWLCSERWTTHSTDNNSNTIIYLEVRDQKNCSRKMLFALPALKMKFDTVIQIFFRSHTVPMTHAWRRDEKNTSSQNPMCYASASFQGFFKTA